MDKNTITGFILIFGILLVWNLTMAPDAQKQLEEKQRIQDSIARVEAENLENQETTIIPQEENTQPEAQSSELDSNQLAQQQNLMKLQYGAFHPAASGDEKEEILENDLMKVTFSNKGGRITNVELKEHFKMHRDSNHVETKTPLNLMEDEKDRFEYLLPVIMQQKARSVRRIYTSLLPFRATALLSVQIQNRVDILNRYTS